MFIKTNSRGYIVEATDATVDTDYTEVQGNIADNMPLGMLGFNGRVYAPNYIYVGDAVVQRTPEDMARDPYSDADKSPSEQERIDALEAAMLEMIMMQEG